MIPRVIHQIWIGPKKMPVEWMETWKEKNPSFQYTLWREKDLEQFGLKNWDKYWYLYKKGLYAGAVDVARVEILNAVGGIYVDADSVCLISLENAPFIKKEFFAGYEYDRRVANGTIGCIPGHPIITEYNVRIGEATVLEPPCYTIGGTMLTSCIDSHGKDSEVEILPSYTFYPKWKHRGQIAGDVYARQMWGTTKNLYETK
jgi:inositol phosphorylceramide mannosyltransferase catalytic subunit